MVSADVFKNISSRITIKTSFTNNSRRDKFARKKVFWVNYHFSGIVIFLLISEKTFFLNVTENLVFTKTTGWSIMVVNVRSFDLFRLKILPKKYLFGLFLNLCWLQQKPGVKYHMNQNLRLWWPYKLSVI